MRLETHKLIGMYRDAAGRALKIGSEYDEAQCFPKRLRRWRSALTRQNRIGVVLANRATNMRDAAELPLGARVDLACLTGMYLRAER